MEEEAELISGGLAGPTEVEELIEGTGVQKVTV